MNSVFQLFARSLRQIAGALALIVALVVATTVVAQQTPSATLSFAVVPQQSALTLVKSWGPLVSYLSERSGLHIRFVTAPTIPEFEARLAAGEYDIAYMNPFHYTQVSADPGYRAIARARDKSITGILVVRKDSALQSLEDLNGKMLAFPAPGAFAATMLSVAELNAREVAFSRKYVNSHDSVYENVVMGLADAGGGVPRTLSTTRPELADQLRILWQSKPFTPHAIAVHPKMDEAIAARIAAALAAMGEQPEQQQALENLQISGWSLAEDADWNDVRDLHITQESE